MKGSSRLKWQLLVVSSLSVLFAGNSLSFDIDSSGNARANGNIESVARGTTSRGSGRPHPYARGTSSRNTPTHGTGGNTSAGNNAQSQSSGSVISLSDGDSESSTGKSSLPSHTDSSLMRCV